jgi:hypothetical protein
MIKLIDYYNTKNGKKKIDFFLLGIYDLLKFKLGFRYTKINKKGYYLKESNGIYEIVGFHKLKDEFKKFVDENYDSLEFSKEVNYNDFMEAYYAKSPIKNGNYAREYLSEDFELSETNLHFIMLKNDPNYNRKHKRNEIIQFLKSEGFIETKGKGGNFSKDCPLFYKKIKENRFLVFNNPFHDDKNLSSTFDFWKIKAHSEKEFLQDKKVNITKIKLEFDLGKDIELYRGEKNV